MSVSAPPSVRSLNTTTRHRILTVHTHVATFTLIAALLLALMLLWHISTITLVENYYMPQWWVKAFLAEHANGWRVAVWVLVGVLVPIDCLHALLCLDWSCATMHSRGSVAADPAKEGGQSKGSMDQEKETNVSMHEETADETREQRNRRAHASTISQLSSRTPTTSEPGTVLTPDGPPHTYHPLLRARYSTKTQNVLLSIFDIFIIITLAAHTVTFFVSLPTAIAFCNIPSGAAYPEREFNSTDKLPSMRDRCIGLNVDIHVAGGFAVFMAIILGMLHFIALAVRCWESVRSGMDCFPEKRGADAGQEAGLDGLCDRAKASSSTVLLSGRSDSTHTCTSSGTARTHAEKTTSTIGPRLSASVSAEERSTGVRLVDWSAGRAGHARQAARMRAGRTDGSETSETVTAWSEVLLECLIDE